MKTEHIQITTEQDKAGIMRAAELLRQGGLVAIPTETVYGLAANALDAEASAKIFAAKGRPADNPLIVHISDLSMLAPLVTEVPEQAVRLAEKYWPGPLTVIMKKSDKIPDSVSAGLETVAVRFPVNPVARAIITACGFPLAAPSANRSGRPSPTTAQHVIHDLDGRVDGIVVSGDCTVGVESTVLSLAGERPRLLRPGAVTVEMIEAVIGPIEVDDAVLHRLKEGRKVSSPGMKYKHYAPKAHVIMVEGDSAVYSDYVNQNIQPGTVALCFDEDVEKLRCPTVPYGSRTDDRSQARELFDALRKLDEIGAVTAYAHAPKKSGVGLAVYNRLIRAAAFEVVSL